MKIRAMTSSKAEREKREWWGDISDKGGQDDHRGKQLSFSAHQLWVQRMLTCHPQRSCESRAMLTPMSKAKEARRGVTTGPNPEPEFELRMLGFKAHVLNHWMGWEYQQKVLDSKGIHLITSHGLILISGNSKFYLYELHHKINQSKSSGNYKRLREKQTKDQKGRNARGQAELLNVTRVPYVWETNLGTDASVDRCQSYFQKVLLKKMNRMKP